MTDFPPGASVNVCWGGGGWLYVLVRTQYCRHQNDCIQMGSGGGKRVTIFSPVTLETNRKSRYYDYDQCFFFSFFFTIVIHVDDAV